MTRDEGIEGVGDAPTCTPRFAAGVASSDVSNPHAAASSAVERQEPKVSGLASVVDSRGEVYHENLGLQNRPQSPAPAMNQGSLPSPARISLLYQSRDGRLCVFEDAEGHLTSVRASRLA